jgi:hypothetical protein
MFTMMAADRGPRAEDVIWLAAAVAVETDNRGRKVLRYHDFTHSERGFYFLDPVRSRHVVPIDDILTPMGFHITPVLGNPGEYTLNAAVTQQVRQTKQAVLDGELGA